MKRSIYLLLAVSAAACAPKDDAGGQCVTVIEEDVTEDTTWGEECSTVEVMTDVDSKAALSVAAGTTVRFDQGTSLYVMDEGSLSANGTAEEPIVFEGLEAEKGFWKGLAFRSIDDANVLEHVTVRDTGKRPRTLYAKAEAAAIIVTADAGSLTMTDVRIEHGAAIGLNVQRNTKIEGSTNVVFADLDGPPIKIRFADVHQIDPSFDHELPEEPSDDPRLYKIHVIGSDLTEQVTWPETFSIYRLDGKAAIKDGGFLEVQPGVRIAFEQEGLISVGEQGGLALDGGEGPQIELSGVESIAGYWAGINYESNSPDNVITNAVISHAGAKIPGRDTVALKVAKGASLTVRDSSFLDIDGHGIQVVGDATLTQSGNDFDVSGGAVVDQEENTIN